MELSPMLYQLLLPNIFYNILDEQKSSPCNPTSLVTRMLMKMKSQPLFFGGALKMPLRQLESLLLEVGNVKNRAKMDIYRVALQHMLKVMEPLGVKINSIFAL